MPTNRKRKKKYKGTKKKKYKALGKVISQTIHTFAVADVQLEGQIVGRRNRLYRTAERFFIILH